MKLLYVALRALCKTAISKELVRYVYECKVLVINGEFPGVPTDRALEESTKYTLNYITASSAEKLYTFKVSDSVLEELRQISTEYMKKIVNHEFKSLEVLQNLC